MDLRLGAENSDYIARRLLVRESDDRIRLVLDIVDEDALLAKKCPVIPPGNGNTFNGVVLVLTAVSIYNRAPSTYNSP